MGINCIDESCPPKHTHTQSITILVRMDVDLPMATLLTTPQAPNADIWQVVSIVILHARLLDLEIT